MARVVRPFLPSHQPSLFVLPHPSPSPPLFSFSTLFPFFHFFLLAVPISILVSPVNSRPSIRLRSYCPRLFGTRGGGGGGGGTGTDSRRCSSRCPDSLSASISARPSLCQARDVLDRPSRSTAATFSRSLSIRPWCAHRVLPRKTSRLVRPTSYATRLQRWPSVVRRNPVLIKARLDARRRPGRQRRRSSFSPLSFSRSLPLFTASPSVPISRSISVPRVLSPFPSRSFDFCRHSLIPLGSVRPSRRAAPLGL